jgi:hypothetical protein
MRQAWRIRVCSAKTAVALVLYGASRRRRALFVELCRHATGAVLHRLEDNLENATESADPRFCSLSKAWVIDTSRCAQRDRSSARSCSGSNGVLASVCPPHETLAAKHAANSSSPRTCLAHFVVRPLHPLRRRPGVSWTRFHSGSRRARLELMKAEPTYFPVARSALSAKAGLPASRRIRQWYSS